MQDVHEVSDGSGGRSRRAALGAALGGALALGLAACGSSSDPQTGEPGGKDPNAPRGGHDLDVVNYALTLEYIEADFYDAVVKGGYLSGEAADLVKLIQQNEHEHVDALEALTRKLGGRPDERPETQFPLAGGGAQETLRLAARIESLGASAYLGQIDQIANREVLAAAASIHSIEARHAGALARLAGFQFTPDGAFASPRSGQEVMDEVRQYIV